MSKDKEKLSGSSANKEQAEIRPDRASAADQREFDEASLEKAFEATERIIDDKSESVLDEAKRRMDSVTSLGVDAAKAQTILHEGGFGKRIAEAKTKILDLVRTTKESLAAIRKGQQERGFLSALRSKGIEQPERAAAIIRYLEDQAVDRDTKGPYSFRLEDSALFLRDLKALAAAPDALELLKDVHAFGVRLEVQKRGILEGVSGLKALAHTPGSQLFLKRLNGLSGKVLAKDVLQDPGEALEVLAALARKNAEQPFLDAAAAAALEKIAPVLRQGIHPKYLEAWIRIGKDETLAAILPALAGRQPEADSRQRASNAEYYEKRILHTLQAIEHAGVAKEFAALVRAGFSAQDIGHPGEATRQAAEVLASSPELAGLMRNMSAVFGMHDALHPETLRRFKSFLEEIPSAPQALAFLAKRGIRANAADVAQFYNPANREEVKEILDAMSEPAFEDFAETCQKAGYRFGAYDFLPSSYATRQDSRLVECYRNPDFRAVLASATGKDIADYLKFFERPASEWNSHLLIAFAKVPDVLATLERLKSVYGYQYEYFALGPRQGEHQALLQLLQDRERCEKLLQPEIAAILGPDSALGAKFSLFDARQAAELLDDQTLALLNNPEVRALLRDIKESKPMDLGTMIAIAHANPGLRPIIRTLATKFDYMPMSIGRPSESVFYEEQYLRELQEKPHILELAERLHGIGFSRNPLQNIDSFQRILDNDLVPIFERYRHSPNTLRMIWNNLDAVSELKSRYPDKIEVYMEIFQKVADSPSQEVQRLREQLLSQLLASEHPIQDYEKIESIFVRNNLPTVGKIFGVFQTLYPDERLAEILKEKPYLSPVLEQSSSRRRSAVIYQDLLGVHIESGNRSLKEYIGILQSGAAVLERYDRGGLESLASREREELRYFIGRLETLLANSGLSDAENAFLELRAAELDERVQNIKQSLKVLPGQTILERVAEMYARPLGLGTLDEVLKVMQRKKDEADMRGRALVAKAAKESPEGQAVLSVAAGDLLKGVDERYIGNILQNGSVAKEFLGASSDSDHTPLDTDVSMVLEGDSAGGTADAIRKSMAVDYGGLLFVIKDRGQFQRTRAGETAKPEAGKRELFATGVGGERHYGIRTGFASTEIDFMVAQEKVSRDPQAAEKIFFEIAQNGFYIPVVDASGTVIFTPEMYEERRRAFAGLAKFGGEPLPFEAVTEESRSYPAIREISAALPENNEKVLGATEAIRAAIQKALSGLGIALRSEFDTSILGAELLDTGSTGRHTNTPGDFDFDFSLKLDVNDFPRASQLAEAIKGIMVMQDDKSHEERGGYYQLRAMGVTQIGDQKFEKPLDIDIGFANKSDLSVYGSHDAIRDKLDFIRKAYGEASYRDAVANIILAKKVLKEGGAYKKKEHGGIGGIGLENWILANGGNLEAAFRSFYEAAHEGGTLLSLEEFRKRYRILDAGVNVKYLGHDNFVDILKPQGYQAMLATIRDYLGF